MVMRRLGLPLILLLHLIFCLVGINWGLPSSRSDRYLFTNGEPWPGEKIARLAKANARYDNTLGADVDRDPLATSDEPVNLTSTDEQIAAIYLRYRLYTHQPDEMITMMALASMKPSQCDLDPKLYQYGGLFIYPVGALIKLVGMTGLIDVTNDLTYYLDHPDEFGKFYIVARLYVVLFSMLGVWAVYLLGKRFGDWQVGVPAALLFVLLPVVVCMSHEAKPHMPATVLMLWAVWLAMRYAEDRRRRDWWALCILCGAAFGMVLSSLPILVLIPLAVMLRPKARTNRLTQTVAGLGVALGVYLIANPYIVINALTNRQVLASNLGNSIAMYEISRIGEGFVRVVQLTADGATWLVFIVGVICLAVAFARRRWTMLPLAIPALVLFAQFVALGAGKPDEYGRFGVFVDTALAIAAAVAIRACWKRIGWATLVPAVAMFALAGLGTTAYLGGFYGDASQQGSCYRAAQAIRNLKSEAGDDPVIMTLREPAPYCFPPAAFDGVTVQLSKTGDYSAGAALAVLVRDGQDREAQEAVKKQGRLIWSSDTQARRHEPRSPISWADKPFEIYRLDKE